jgi:hypothetical protein
MEMAFLNSKVGHIDCSWPGALFPVVVHDLEMPKYADLYSYYLGHLHPMNLEQYSQLIAMKIRLREHHPTVECLVFMLHWIRSQDQRAKPPIHYLYAHVNQSFPLTRRYFEANPEILAEIRHRQGDFYAQARQLIIEKKDLSFLRDLYPVDSLVVKKDIIPKIGMVGRQSPYQHTIKFQLEEGGTLVLRPNDMAYHQKMAYLAFEIGHPKTQHSFQAFFFDQCKVIAQKPYVVRTEGYLENRDFTEDQRVQLHLMYLQYNPKLPSTKTVVKWARTCSGCVTLGQLYEAIIEKFNNTVRSVDIVQKLLNLRMIVLNEQRVHWYDYEQQVLCPPNSQLEYGDDVLQYHGGD